MLLSLSTASGMAAMGLLCFLCRWLPAHRQKCRFHAAESALRRAMSAVYKSAGYASLRDESVGYGSDQDGRAVGGQTDVGYALPDPQLRPVGGPGAELLLASLERAEDMAGVDEARHAVERDPAALRGELVAPGGLRHRDPAGRRMRGDPAVHAPDGHPAVGGVDVDVRVARDVEDHVHPPRLGRVDLRTVGGDLAVPAGDADRAEDAQGVLAGVRDGVTADDQARRRAVPAADRETAFLRRGDVDALHVLERQLALLLI